MTYEQFTAVECAVLAGDKVVHPTLGTGKISRISEDGTIGTFQFLGRKVAFRLATPDLDWCPRPERKNPHHQEREWTPKTREFLKDCYEYLVEKQPLFEPFGRDGKKLQADWREQKGYSYVDPVMSTLSSWGCLLVGAGYAIKDSNGFWYATDKVWSDA